jgi:hypothetical protein
MTTNDEPKPATEGVHNPDVPDVAAELTRILEAKNADGTPRWSLQDFHATFPPMILGIMAHVPFLEMPPEGQELCLMAMGQMGLDTDATDEAIALAITSYVEQNPPNEAMLGEIQGMLIKAFDKNDARLIDASRKLAGQSAVDVAARVPKHGEKPKEGTVSGADLARQMQRKIPMR